MNCVPLPWCFCFSLILHRALPAADHSLSLCPESECYINEWKYSVNILLNLDIFRLNNPLVVDFNFIDESDWNICSIFSSNPLIIKRRFLGREPVCAISLQRTVSNANIVMSWVYLEFLFIKAIEDPSSDDQLKYGVRVADDNVFVHLTHSASCALSLKKWKTHRVYCWGIRARENF